MTVQAKPEPLRGIELKTENERSSSAVRPQAGLFTRLGKHRAASDVNNNLLHAGLLALVDQSLISGTNFVTTVLVANAVGLNAFGQFALASMVLMFANGIQASIITEPQSVIGASKSKTLYAKYVSSVGVLQLCFALLVSLLILVATLIARIVDWNSTLLIALLPAAVAWQIQEFTRRVLYARGLIQEALKNDVMSYGGQAIGVIVLWRTNHLTGALALLVLAATSTVGCVIGMWQIRSLLESSVQLEMVRSTIRDHWQFGKWLVGSTILNWTSAQIYPVFIAAFVGVAATGAMRAMLTIVGPSQVLLFAMGSLLTPVVAGINIDGGVTAVNAFARRLIVITSPLILLFCISVSVFSRPLVEIVYGREYVEYSWILIFLSVFYLMLYVQTILSLCLRAVEATTQIFVGYFWSTSIVMTVGLLAVYTVGLWGASIGLVIHGVIMNVALWRSYRKRIGSILVEDR
jgi:O-antigen/teichoic acid export membrane protein